MATKQSITQLIVESLIGKVEGVDNLSEETGEMSDENKVVVIDGGKQFIVTIEENTVDITNSP